MSVYSQAFKNCLCGDGPVSETLNDCFGCKPKCGWVWKIIYLIFLSILALAIATGLGYLILGVGTNAFSLLFDDTVCTNWIWQTCGSYVEMNIGYSTSGIQYLAGGINAGFIVGLVISITVLYFMRISLVSFFTMYATWAYLWIWISLFTGKQLAVHKFDGCEDYKNYGIILMNLFRDYGTTLCAKIKNIGPNKGAIQDNNLPGNWDTCNKCMNMGFWTIYLSALLLPLVILSIILLIRRFQRKLKEAKNMYQPLSTM